MGITMTTTGRSGKPERPSFFPIRAHLLTTCPQGRRWYPSRWSGRALCEADCALYGERQTMPLSLRASVVIACTAGSSVFAWFGASLQTVVLCRDNLPPACENLPPAALSQLWTMHPLHRPFSFVPAKETKPPFAGGRKEVKDYGDLSPGSEGREPWGGSIRLRGFCLSELFRHL